MNLIFLDFDEVLNSSFFRVLNKKYIKSQRAENSDIYNKENRNSPHHIDIHIQLKANEIDSEAMKLLNILVTRVDAKVVICSSWRHISPFVSDSKEETIARFKTLFKKVGYPDFPVIGFTGYKGFRGYEVAEFLDEFSKTNTVDNYLIIDDGGDFFIDDLTIMTDEEIVDYAGWHNRKNDPVFPDPQEFRSKSHFWSSQPLLRTNLGSGLSRNDIMSALGHFNPDDVLAEIRRDSAPYEHNQGLYNSKEPDYRQNVPPITRIRPR